MTDPRLPRLRSDVASLYDRNRQRGHAAWCGKDYDFVCPSSGTYPFQWLWDSSFHAVVLSHLDPVRAESEIRSLLHNQHDDGMVSHVTFWQRERYEEMLATYSIAYRTPHLSDCLQPPLLAEAVWAVQRRGRGASFVREVMPKVRAFYDFWDKVRDPDRDGLVATLQPDESGLDHTPKYDALLGVREATEKELTRAWGVAAGPYAGVNRDVAKMFELDVFNVEDVLVNSIYAENQKVCADLHDLLGETEEAGVMRARAKKTTAALVTKCFDEKAGLFFDVAGKAETQQKVSTVSSLLPLILDDLPDACVKALVRHVKDEADYLAKYPVPSVSMKEPSFSAHPSEPKLVWRGPTWINTNWYVTRGLRRHGEKALAERIEDASVELVFNGGFREHYNPLTGEGYGAHDFSWTALVLDMIAAREETL